MKKRNQKIATNWLCGEANSYSINHIFVFPSIYTSLLLAIIRGVL